MFCSSSAVFYPPAAERFSPLVKIVLNRDRQSTDWDRQMDAVAQNQPQQVRILEKYFLLFINLLFSTHIFFNFIYRLPKYNENVSNNFSFLMTNKNQILSFEKLDPGLTCLSFFHCK